MIITDESVFLSLATGAVIGVLAVVNKVIISTDSGKWFGKFVADFTFAALSCVITFTMSIPLSRGRIRFFQLVLELIGALAVYYVFADLLSKICLSIRRGKQRMKSTVFDRVKSIGDKISKKVISKNKKVKILAKKSKKIQEKT